MVVPHEDFLLIKISASFPVEIVKLILKFTRKCKRPTVAPKKTLKQRTKLEDSHELISRLFIKLLF